MDTVPWLWICHCASRKNVAVAAYLTDKYYLFKIFQGTVHKNDIYKFDRVETGWIVLSYFTQLSKHDTLYIYTYMLIYIHTYYTHIYTYIYILAS
jgi:hypothetical protein